MSTASYNTLNSEGVNFNTTYTAYDQTAAISATNSPDNPGPPFSQGTYMRGTNEAEFVFVKATAAIAVGSVCLITPTYTAAGITTSTATLGNLVGVGVVAIASGSYGWLQRAGTVDGGVLTVAATNANIGLLATTGAGVLASATTTGNKNITGVVLTTTNGSSNTAVSAAVLNYPVVGTTTT
jgi:hypothetical protein